MDYEAILEMNWPSSSRRLMNHCGGNCIRTEITPDGVLTSH
jgi:hypothetical protein